MLYKELRVVELMVLLARKFKMAAQRRALCSFCPGENAEVQVGLRRGGREAVSLHSHLLS